MVDKGSFLSYVGCRDALFERLGESAPSRIQILAGPRQVGKTTLLHEIESRYGEAASYAAGDDPRALEPGYWDRVWRDAAERARAKKKAVLLVDEVQHFADWSSRLKGEWDRVKRERLPLHVVATGSSALAVGAGSRESLAGRFERLILSHWSASAVADVFGISAEKSLSECIRFGSYPGARSLLKDVARWRAYVRDAIIEPAIGRDILALHAVRRPALLRQVFALAVGLPASIVSLQKIQGQLTDKGAIETVAHYLSLLEDAFLVAGLPKYSDRAHRQRAAPPKLVVLNTALLSAMHPEGPPDPKSEPARFGGWIENACLAHAWNAGHAVTYWREEPLEVDGVIEGNAGKWAIEVKTGPVGHGELRGLLEFCSRHREFRPLLLTDPSNRRGVESPGVTVSSWQDFLLGKVIG